MLLLSLDILFLHLQASFSPRGLFLFYPGFSFFHLESFVILASIGLFYILASSVLVPFKAA